jgi:hypothetical protein
MATMIPDDVQTFSTAGEKTFYAFLQHVAKPDEHFLVWYCPDVNQQEPDFVLYHKSCGIVIFEVKDWALDQIVEADPHFFKLKIGEKIDTRTNPLQQANGYRHRLLDLITRDGRLVSKDPLHAGKPVLPVACAVVFANINKYAYQEKGMDRIISAGQAFFWDDLHPQSDICSDPSGHCFATVFDKMFPPLFPFKMGPKEMDHLKQLLFPTVRVELPVRSRHDYRQRSTLLKSLDNHQEAIARKFDGGHRILSGPSGSGKTLILVHQAAFLRKYNPAVQSILFVCFNITLVHYIKRLLAARGLPLGERGIHVTHIYQLCADILKETVPFEKEENDYYELIVQYALDKLADAGPRYDAVLVDEGQDFSVDMLKVVTALLNPKTNHLTIALDGNQNLYRGKFSWADAGIHARGRVHRIDNVYRSTRQLSLFASSFVVGAQREMADGRPVQAPLFPDFFDFTGPPPRIEKFRDFDQICLYLADKIAETVQTDDCPYSEVAVLYAKKRLVKDSAPTVPEMISDALATRGIFSNWVSKDYLGKTTYDITTNSVAISTIHSAKGLDFAHVFLVGLDTFDEGRFSAEHIERLTYVGITRARYQLFIPYIRKTPLIEKLLSLIHQGEGEGT